MKKLLTVVMALIMVFSCTAALADDSINMVTYMTEGHANGANTPAFLPGTENRPSKVDMETILSLANTYFQCHSLTGTHFIVIQDQAEQEEILSLFHQHVGLDCSGTNMVLVMADGLKDQEHHAAQYYPGVKSENGGNPEYWNMYYGIYEAGWANGYLNLLATSLGYRTRTYAALNIANAEIGEVDVYGTGGNFAYITGENWDIAKYMNSKDGTVHFDHYVEALDDVIPCEGNVTLLAAVLIGKVDESVDAVASATVNNPPRMQNYDFWDWDDDYADTEAAPVDAESSATATVEETGETKDAEEQK